MNRTELKIKTKKSFKCPDCDEVFKTYSMCEDHIINVHLPEPEETEMWTCPVCEEIYVLKEEAEDCINSHPAIQREKAIQEQLKEKLIIMGRKPGQTKIANPACVITKAF